MDQNALEVADLTKTFGGIHAVQHVSMKVPVGQRRAIIGPNGAGKTTLFNCIAGSLSPSAGRISLFGQDVSRFPEHRRTSMGIGRTFQITNVFHKLTVMENVLLAVNGTRSRKWVMHRPVAFFSKSLDEASELLHLVGLAQRSAVSVQRLSYGERRQLEIALALASKPRVLLLDEPASGLSPGERQNIAGTIKELPRDITVILIEHDMSVVLGLADQVAVLHHGRLLIEGTPDEVRADAEVREVYLGKV
jgi:branched-chain amino acid transport system ATP-binding protein